jgi:hypothetical protein
MWSYFRSTAPTPPPATRARLNLEALDSRSSPSALLDPITGAQDEEYIAAPAPGGDSPPDPDQPAAPAPDASTTRINQPPQIINFIGVQDTGNIWRFTGDVADEAAGGLTISFGGEPVTLQGKTTSTDANGHFDVLIAMNTDGSDDGEATAQTVDPQGAPSNVAIYSIMPSA